MIPAIGGGIKMAGAGGIVYSQVSAGSRIPVSAYDPGAHSTPFDVKTLTDDIAIAAYYDSENNWGLILSIVYWNGSSLVVGGGRVPTNFPVDWAEITVLSSSSVALTYKRSGGYIYVEYYTGITYSSIPYRQTASTITNVDPSFATVCTLPGTTKWVLSYDTYQSVTCKVYDGATLLGTTSSVATGNTSVPPRSIGIDSSRFLLVSYGSNGYTAKIITVSGGSVSSQESGSITGSTSRCQLAKLSADKFFALIGNSGYFIDTSGSNPSVSSAISVGSFGEGYDVAALDEDNLAISYRGSSGYSSFLNLKILNVQGNSVTETLDTTVDSQYCGFAAYNTKINTAEILSIYKGSITTYVVAAQKSTLS